MGRDGYWHCGHLQVCQTCEFYDISRDVCFFYGEHWELPDENGVRHTDIGCGFGWDHEERGIK